MAETLTSGVRITVDTSDIDVKFTKSVEQLNAGLTKTQKNLHLFYNEEGLLSNALGQTVEGLSTAQIKLGQYVDDLGRVRTFQGGFTTGLNKSQIAMGFYSDALGNVFNKTGALVIPTQKLDKSLQKTAQTTTQVAQAETIASAQADAMGAKFAAAGGKIAAATSTVGALASNFLLFSNSADGAAGAVAACSVAVSQAVVIFSAWQQIQAFANSLKAAAASAGMLNAALTALGGPVGIALLAVGAIVAAGAALFKWRADHITKVSQAYKDLAKEAKRAGENVRDLHTLLTFGVFGQSGSGGDSIEAMRAQIDALVQKLKDFKTSAGGFFLSPAWVADSENQIKNLIAAINDRSRDLVAQAVESAKAPSEKTAESLKEYQQLLNDALKAGSGATDAEKVALQKKVAELSKLLQQQKKEEVDQKVFNGIIANVDTFAKSQASAAVDLEQFRRNMRDLDHAVMAHAVDYQAARTYFFDQLDENAAKIASLTDISADAVRLASTFANADATTRDAVNQLTNAFKTGAVDVQAFAQNLKPLEIQAEREAIASAMRRAADAYDSGAITAAQFAALDSENRQKLEGLTFQEIDLTKSTVEQLQKLANAYAAGALSQAAYNNELDKKRAQLAQELGVQINADAATPSDVAQKLDAARRAYESNALTTQQLSDVVNQLQSQATAFGSPLSDLENWIKTDPSAAAREKYAQTLDALAAQEAKSYAEIERAQDVRASADAKLAAAQKARADTLAQIAEAQTGGWLDEKAAADARREEERKLAEAQAARATAYDGAAEIEKNAATLQEQAASGAIEAERQLSRDLERAAVAGDALATAELDYADTLAQIARLQAAGVYSKERADQLRQAAESRLTAAQEKAAEQAEKDAEAQRRATRSSLSVDSILESLKTPAQKFANSVEKIADAVDSGAVTMQEAQALVQQASNDYGDKLAKNAEKAREEERKNVEKLGAGVASADVGSTALYNAVIRTQGVQYQEAIKQTTANILDATREGVEFQRATAWATETLASALSNSNAVEVWG